MEAKDTVISVEVKGLAIPSSQVQAFLVQQAEISFKAGQEYERGQNYDREVFIYEKGKKAGEVEGYKQGLEMREPYKAGIKVVVDWINSHTKGNKMKLITNYLPVSEIDWEAKLKEWDI